MSLYFYFEQKFNRTDLGLLVLRVVFGTVIFLFGVDKLLGGGATFEFLGKQLEMFGITWQPKFWGLLCALVETFGGLCMVLGLFFRPAAMLLVCNMIVASAATFQMTGAPIFSSMDAFVTDWLGKVAVPVYFLAAFLALLFTGPGKYAIHKKGGGGKSGAKASAKE